MKIAEVTAPHSANIEQHVRFYQDQFEPGHVAAGPASRFLWHYDPQYPLDRIAALQDAIQIFQFDQGAWAEEGEESRFDDMLNEPIREPIIVVEIDGLGRIWDGMHRVGASLLIGSTTIPAYVGVPKSD